MNALLETKLRHLPAHPGVYLFKDAAGEVLYVGKANALRSRVRSYFGQDHSGSMKTRELVRRIMDVDTIVVGSEAEALLLEANLIKQHHPRFNIQLRDDKRYPYIKVTVQEPFPRVYVTRNLENDGARYFGPYTDVGPMRQALELIKRRYTVRSCKYNLPGDAPERPCLDFHIGRCLGPCVGLQSRDDYRGMIDEIVEVLNGRTEKVRRRVQAEMKAAADALDYERAGALRDVLTGLEAIERRQRMLDVRGGDQDVLGVARDGDHACAVQLRIRGGKLLGREVSFFENADDESEESLLAAATSRFYLGQGEHGTSDLPKELLFPASFPDMPLFEEVLRERAGKAIHARVPQKGEKASLVRLASQNARHLLEERSVLSAATGVRAEDVLYELQEALELKVVPRMIVCFDISHLQGSEVVGSGVAFRNGEPHKAEYRRFRVRGDWGNDDFRSMAEVVGRYVRRRIEEVKPLPELIVIDGGKGQLGAAVAAAREHGAADIAFCSLAKRDEEVFLPDRPAPVRLPRTSPALRLLQRVRDEAHRFAHGYNSRLRTKRTVRSELADIPGIGPARERTLLARFGSLRGVRSASAAEIAAAIRIPEQRAREILALLNPVVSP